MPKYPPPLPNSRFEKNGFCPPDHVVLIHASTVKAAANVTVPAVTILAVVPSKVIAVLFVVTPVTPYVTPPLTVPVCPLPLESLAPPLGSPRRQYAVAPSCNTMFG